MLEEPDEYRKLLDGFHYLLGNGGAWWKRCAEAEDPKWHGFVRAALIEAATQSKTTPEWLDVFLERPLSCYGARQRVLSLARTLFYADEAER